MLVQAPDAATALELCEARLKALRANTTLFSDPCTILLRSAIRVPATIRECLLVNYVSEDRPKMSRAIACALPEQDADLDVYGFEPDDAGHLAPFVDFSDPTSAADG
jgi:hypothetical protein